jgi:TM2 domain-containing membrane protein YozV
MISMASNLPAPSYGTPPAPRPPMTVAPRSPLGGVILSFFIPGAGTMYAGEVGAGIAFLAATVVSVLAMVILVGFVTTPLIWIFAMIHAHQAVQRWNRRHGVIS